MTLQDTREITAGGHVYNEMEIGTYPSYKTEGAIRVYCEICRIAENITLPKISEEHYTKISGDIFNSEWEYIYKSQKFTFTIAEETSKYTFTANTDNDPFIAKNGGGVKDGEGAEVTIITEDAANGKYFYANAKDNTRRYTFKVYVSENTTVKLYFGLAKNNATLAPNKVIQNLKVDGIADGVTYSTTSLSWTKNSTNWFVFKECYVAIIELKAGENTITFDVIDTSLNIDSVIFESIIPVEIKKQDTAQ